ncbi:uncharacterized protein LOC131689068 [Topomyia yanbarensis]|uniref:uncharacterized protein LOC131689068 n=1 Tax=Topomyia yanbarensis TaxID=2498891 RepID=UPI00273AA137|nr:uncharacterized protein LOC131689068 [Topomyia yanbarensis]XP_058829835.1 uncharacterized protein LOC131689068 [Topomyia yanbarensis]XP_058829836.1 uncharacterized protein LOC131689068 [Topomyia yanbarensis]XP_058829837.1 uncharacterized protein LOC131689068 [Topomyia yanbarensis]
MKVDKAVCTDTYEDLSRTIRFETVFSTLIENKILAIKRECELKKRNKKSKVIRRILFGRKSCRKLGRNVSIEGSRSKNVSEGDDEEAEEEATKGGQDGAEAIGGLPVENSIISDGADEVIVEVGDLSSLVDTDGNVLAIESEVRKMDDYQSTFDPEAVRYGISGMVDGVTSVNLDPDDAETGRVVGQVSLADESIAQKSEATAQSIEDDRKSFISNDVRYRERASTLEPVSVSIEIEPHSDPLSTQYDLEDSATNVSVELDVSEISEMKRSIASEPVPIIKNVSRYGGETSVQPSLPGTTSHRLRVLEAKSISAQNSPILQRQKSTEARHLTFSTATYQTTSMKSKKDIEDTSFVIDLSRETGADNGDTSGATSNLNSIVIQPDKQPAPDGKRSSHKKSVLVVGDSSSSSASRKNKLNPASTSSDHHYHSKRFSDVVVYDQSPPPTPGLIESFNQLTTPNLPVITMRQSASPVSDMIKLHRMSAAGSGSRSGNFPAQAQLHQEFSNQTKPQLTTTIISELSGSGSAPGRKQRHGFLRQSSCDVELHYRPSSGASSLLQHQQQPPKQQERHKSRRYSRDSFSTNRATTLTAGGWGDYGDDPVVMAELNESDEEKLNKRKYKYLKRCSDPVIVFPSTSTGGGGGGGGSMMAGPSGMSGGFGSSGLQHCILSRPPNQPIQFPYDEDFMYDVSLQLESDRHGELDSIVPEHKRRHKHRHHHHHNCKKKRHKKRRILVHDLDDQSVKVIDPDELPKRARWTIIATAFLLLIMCLFLVGLTLRMAPIIDDMVRQENERLMRESLDRARMIKNYTEYNRLMSGGGGDEIP